MRSCALIYNIMIIPFFPSTKAELPHALLTHPYFLHILWKLQCRHSAYMCRHAASIHPKPRIKTLAKMSGMSYRDLSALFTVNSGDINLFPLNSILRFSENLDFKLHYYLFVIHNLFSRKSSIIHCCYFSALALISYHNTVSTRKSN